MPSESHPEENPTLHPEVIRKIRHTILRWGKYNYLNYPWRDTEEGWYCLIAEILLQRTRASNVIDVYNNFKFCFPTIDHLANASIDRIESVIQPLGLRWRASHLKRLGEHLVSLGGKIPNNYQGLIDMPGVGDYVASAWLSFHGGKRYKIIDTNIVRFICRITGQTMTGETRRKKWLGKIVEELTPSRNWKFFNYAMLDFTMLVCAKNPLCELCPIGPRYCSYGKTKIADGVQR